MKKKIIGEAIQEFTGVTSGKICIERCCENNSTKSVTFYKGDPIPCVCQGKACEDPNDPGTCVDDNEAEHYE